MRLSSRLACTGVVLVSATTACSSLVTPYDIPDDICNIGLPAEEYQRLLPAGEKVRATYDVSDRSFVCDVQAGRYTSMRIGVGFNGDKNHIEKYSGAYQLENARIVEGDHENRVWPNYAKAMVMCESNGTQRPMNITIHANYPNDSAKSQDALAEFIQPLAVQLSAFCEEPPSPQTD